VVKGTAQRNMDDYSWADYLIYFEGGTETSLQSLRELTVGTARPAKDRVVWGLLCTVTLSIVATLLSTLPVWPFTLAKGYHPIEPVMLALILGMIVGNLWIPPRAWSAGIKYSIKKALPIGIILMGVRLNFSDLLKAGAAGVALSVAEVLIAIVALNAVCRWLNLTRKMATLLGVGTGICGGSAIIAVAPVIEADEAEVTLSVATISLLGLLGMFALPFVGHLLELSSRAFGTWAGLAIHQTPQVIAAGFAYSTEAGEVATVVKLARVCLLAPVVFFVGLSYRRRESSSQMNHDPKIHYTQMIPTFVLGFFTIMMLRSLGLVPEVTFHLPQESLLGPSNHSLNLLSLLRGLSSWCIVVSMAGIGLETNLTLARKTGVRPFVAGLIAALVISFLSLWAIHLIHL